MRALNLLVVAAWTLSLAGCPASMPPPVRPTPITSGETPAPGHPRITWQRVETAADLPPAPPPGTFRIHLIDVGTGLSILLQGSDFTMLFDAGTNDAEERPLRVVSYLEAVLGPSGDDLCGVSATAPAAPRVMIPNVVLSHPHFDHASALDLVFHCYDVQNFWNSGAVNQAKFYADLMTAVAASPLVVYHTAADVPDDHVTSVRSVNAMVPRWQLFHDGDMIELGKGARATILHADGKQKQDANENSIVLAVELGTTRLLLVGDAESGARKDPTYPVGDVEEMLLDEHKDQLRADILQVGHHGSMTSSRQAFIEAVHPVLALVSSGPKHYGKVTLPDPEVIDELVHAHVTVLRTDERDANCPVVGRIGGDHGPGGCDSWVITIEPPVLQTAP